MERISFVLVLFCAFFNHISGQCPTSEANVQEWGNSCYYFMQPYGGYDQAKDYCERTLGGGYKLLHIDSQAEQDYIRSTIIQYYIDFERTFLGAKETRGALAWVSDGTSIQASEGCVQSYERNLFNSGPIAAVSSKQQCKEQCNAQAAQLGTYYAYSAVRFYDPVNLGGMECFCGNNFPEPQAYCNTPCPNDGTQMCGNIESNRVDEWGQPLESIVTAAFVSSNMAYEAFMDWADHQPSSPDYGGVDCVVFSGENWDAYKWAKQPCHQELKFICQYPQPNQQSCQNAGYTWTFTQDVNRCFKLFDTPRNFIGARIQCMAGGGDLAKSDLEAYNTELKQSAQTWDGSNPSNWWIGASKSEWKWDDGGSFVDFEEFAVRQPDSASENCLVISRNAGGGDNYHWEDSQCTNNYHFVCEYNPKWLESNTTSSSQITEVMTSQAGIPVTTVDSLVEVVTTSSPVVIITTQVTTTEDSHIIQTSSALPSYTSLPPSASTQTSTSLPTSTPIMQPDITSTLSSKESTTADEVIIPLEVTTIEDETTFIEYSTVDMNTEAMTDEPALTSTLKPAVSPDKKSDNEEGDYEEENEEMSTQPAKEKFTAAVKNAELSTDEASPTTTTKRPTNGPTRAPATTKPTPATTPTTARPATTPTRRPGPVTKPASKATTTTTTTTTIGGGAVSGTEKSWIEEKFTTGVIVAVVICGVAVIVAFLRLLVYCCQRKSGGDIES